MAEALFPQGLDGMLADLSRRLLQEWAEEELEVVVGAEAALLPLRETQALGAEYCLSLMIAPGLLARIEPRQGAIEARILDCARALLPAPLREKLASVGLCPRGRRRDWRAEAEAWLRGAPPAPAAAPPPAAPQRLLDVQVRVPEEPGARSPLPLRGEKAPPDPDEPVGPERYRVIRVRG